MYKFGEKHPVLFEMILLIVSFAAAAAITIAGNMFNLHPDLSTSIARIAAGVVLLILYRRAFKNFTLFTNPVLVLPALLFAVWNIFYYLSCGMAIGGLPFFLDGIITAIAPALFEEVLFRGIFIYNLKKNGRSNFQCLFISAILFSLVHLTNLVGQSPAAVALQTGYSFVIGLVFAAIYLKNGSITQTIAVHFLIDYTNSIFMESPTQTSNLQLVIFGLLLLAETIYAVVITAGKPAAEK